MTPSALASTALPTVLLGLLCLGCGSSSDPVPSDAGTADGVSDVRQAPMDDAADTVSDTAGVDLDTPPRLTEDTATQNDGGEEAAISFHFAYGMEPMGLGVDEVTLYASDEVQSYAEAAGFQIDVRVQTNGVETASPVTLYVAGAQAAEWLVIEGMETLFQMVTLPLSVDGAAYEVRVEATSGDGDALQAAKLVTVSEAPPPTNGPPTASCDTLQELLMAQMAVAGAGCEDDSDCAFMVAPVCDLGPHLTCHILAYTADADISGIQQLLDTYTGTAAGCDVMMCDCQGTGAACFSGLCKATGY